MTETKKPPPCHYDRHLGRRVTREHVDACIDNTCKTGCKPCTAPHCRICGRSHVTNDHPHTCVGCIGKIRTDLDDIRQAYAALSREALAAGADGRLVAAAPIPGGTAQVLIGPYVRLDLMRTYTGYTREHFGKDHRSSDPLPPLAVLAQWEDMWRVWSGNARRHATIGGSITYLRDHVADMAQQTEGPDFVVFARQVRTLRSHLEQALHDERDPERGVECFECGDQLVRRFKRRNVCLHSTEARTAYMTLRTYPELQVRATEAIAARAACPECNQGGITDPAAGLSWECPGCRKEYTAGEYITAVRRGLVDNEDAWTTIINASAAAATLTGRECGDKTIRGWIGRGWVLSKLDVRADGRAGGRLVFWPDVKREAMRLSVGRYHCTHRTPARDWLAVLATYPELDAFEAEVDAARIECGACTLAVTEALRHARGIGVA